METKDWIDLLAILFSPLIAVLVTVFLQNRKEKRGHKLFVLESLMGTRHAQLTDENVRSLNMIDMIFSDKTSVRKLWHEYYGMLSNEGLNNPTGWEQRNKKRLELITEMARILGYEKAITHLDVDRVYTPQYFVNQFQRNEDIANELLAVLKQLVAILEAKKESKTPLIN